LGAALVASVKVVGGGGTSHMHIRGPRPDDAAMVRKAFAAYSPVSIIDMWEGPLPFQGKHLGTLRVPWEQPWFARVVKAAQL